MLSANFDMPRRHAKRALVTGGTDGIGKEVALGLARAGHQVVIVGRDVMKGLAAMQEIRKTTGNPEVEFLGADLSLMGEARRVADEIFSRWPTGLHYLAHSAGGIRGHRVLTEEGVESNFALSYLSRFTLTTRLLPLLERAGKPGDAARIVIVGGAAQGGTIHFDDIHLANGFGTVRMLGQVCQANDVFTVELARRLARTDAPRVTITCFKIGVAKTNTRHRPGFPTWMKLLAPLLDPFLAHSAEAAGAAALKMLLDKEFEGVSGELVLMVRKFKRIPAPASVTNPETGKRLWDLSERLSQRASAAVTGELISAHQS